MSKIVWMNAQLSAAENMNAMLNELRLKDPKFAKIIEDLELDDVIEECIQGAFKTLENQGVEITDHICDFGRNETKSFDGQKIIGALKTSKLPNGLGITLKNGVVRFAADEYRSEWKEEIKRLKKMFTDAYLLEAAKAALEILGYRIEPTEKYTTGAGNQSFNVIGIKAGE